MASMTSLAVARAVVAEHAQVQRYAPGATPRYIRVSAVPPGLPRDERRHVRAVPEAVDAVAAREVHRQQRPALQRVVLRIDPRIDDRHRDAPARQLRQVAHAGPHLIGADAFGHRVGSTTRRPTRGPAWYRTFARQVIDRLVLLQRRQLAGVHPQHGAAAAAASA